MNPILNIEKSYQSLWDVAKPDESTERNHFSSHAGRVSRHYGKQWFR